MPTKRKSKKKSAYHEKPMIFTPLNYKLIGLGILLVILGFVAMRLENEVYGFISLYISPVVILSGYAAVLYGILKKDHKTSDKPKENVAG